MQEINENELDEIKAQIEQENLKKCWHNELLDRFLSKLESGNKYAKQIAENFNASKPSAAELKGLLQNDSFVRELEHFFIYGCCLNE